MEHSSVRPPKLRPKQQCAAPHDDNRETTMTNTVISKEELRRIINGWADVRRQADITANYAKYAFITAKTGDLS